MEGRSGRLQLILQGGTKEDSLPSPIAAAQPVGSNAEPMECAMVRTVHGFLIWLSAVSFFVFGSACFVSDYMKREFTRYGLASQRALVGALQLVGGVGLLVGLGLPWIGQIAAGGLAILMLLGVGVRIRIRDSVFQTIPAFFYMLLNAFIALAAF